MTRDELEQLADLVAARLASTEPLLDATGAAVLLNVPESWLRNESRRGRCPHVMLGKYMRWRRVDLLAWIEERAT
jgi:hypothetical protein